MRRRNGDDTSSPPKTRKRCHSRIKIENTDRSNRWISVAGSLGIFNEHNDAKVPKAQSIKYDVQSNNDTPTRRRKCNGKLVGNVLGIFYEDVDNLDVDGLQFLKHQSKSVKSNQHLAHEHTTIDLKNNPRISCGIPPRLQQLQAQKSSYKLTKVNINTPPRKKVLDESRKNIVSTPTLTDSEAPKTIDYAQGTQEAVIDIDDSDDEEKGKYSSQQSAVPVKYKKALKRPLHMNHVKRINVHSPGAKDMITECRQNGCPIVLRGHNGWVNFAKPWLRSNLVEMINHEDDDIDLWNQNFSIDYNKMIEDIGNEEVPVLDVNYDPNNISESMTSMPLVTFLNCHWRHRKGSAFYLHQWQFPLSETAKPKLCMQSKPLTIFGEDILKYYGIDGDDDDDDGDINADELKDNVYQYLFMGSTGSKTLLHVDPGGLDMTIAPITGRKECILVHRDDGDCLYGLDAMLDSDVDEYPLLNQARIWKTVIKPGEILLMPQGTYHECRNITSCLSYSRFILDTVNLMPFFRSCMRKDATEIKHADILFNCALDLHLAIGDFINRYNESGESSIAPYSITEKVRTLRVVRCFIRELEKSASPQDKVEYQNLMDDIENTLVLYCKKFEK